MPQTILWGIDSLKDLIGGRKFLLVSDSAFDYLPIKSFFDNTNHVKFNEFTPNPLYEQVVAGVNAYIENNCEMIVAVGGGSSIDVAKCIKLFAKMDKSENFLNQTKFDSKIILIAIPTTAGTGSESTRHAVIYYNGEKQSISHESIVPNACILEPSVLKGLPLYQKKCTMLDALSQAIESWWNVNSTIESKIYSKKAMMLIKDNWREYIENKSDIAAKNIMEAANLSGRAINITATTAAHAMSYKITSLYKLPHGHAVAICLKRVWKYMLKHTDDCTDERGEEYLKCVFAELPVSYDWLLELMEKLEMNDPVSENRENDLDILAKSVNPVRLKNNPVYLSENTLRKLYEDIIK